MHFQFEFHAYKGDEYGVVSENAEVVTKSARSDSAARAMAGALAKKVNGPVDLAHVGNEPWNDRYVTTASPSEFHASGYRFERLV